MSIINKRNEKAATGSVELNFIGNGVSIKGDMQCDKDLRLDGYIEGNLRVEAKLVLGKAGKVKGTIFANNADISGEVNGNLEVKENLILRDSALINGDIKSNKINIEGGAVFNGTCIMTNAKASTEKKNSFAEPTAKPAESVNQII